MKRNIDTSGLDNFFSFISKAVIIIPITVVILSLIFKFGQLKTGRINPKTGLINQAPTEISIVQNNSFKFDLKGPIICDTLFIKDKKVLYKNKITNYLLTGDCLYIWEEGKIDGEKKCDLTNYVNIAESYLSSLNINDLVNNNLVKDFTKDKNIDVQNVLNSCRKEEIKDESIFKIPEKVLFGNKK